MEGPTPVSSLLHAATMVAAGVHARSRFPLLWAAPFARDIIAWVGALTCLAAALMATQQNDIKRILAYSTISQLGYMVLGAGVAPGPDVQMFHLFTHAFFKCSSYAPDRSSSLSITSRTSGTWEGLKGKTPITFACLIVGTLALSGFPGFSGYFSKDLIIEWAVVEKPILGWIAVVTGADSLLHVSAPGGGFLGARSDHAEHAHESPPVMTIPLILLAIPAWAAGLRLDRKDLSPRGTGACPHIVHYVLLLMFVLGAGSRYGFIATWGRTRSLFHFSPTDFTSTISTTGWSESAGWSGHVEWLGGPLDC